MREWSATRYWIVWNIDAKAATYRHWTRSEAEAEARRLAAQHPGHEFTVLKAMAGFKCHFTPPEEIQYVAPGKPHRDGDPLPF